MPILELQNISFSYGKTNVIDNFNLSVEKGNFTTLLGSSGCGKTTILRLISGFLNPLKGAIKINGEIQNGILPNKRKIGMVFQDYALFPHLTVEQNLYYGLKMQKNFRAKKEVYKELIMKTAENLSLQNLLNRYPSQLSGGQQQRVALGRSLVLEPKILLMDEPLSSLDTNLRIMVREELKEIQQKLNITTIYVTHDQEEALSLSDKIAIMHKGTIVQYDSPQKIYFEPVNVFAANFAGRANIIQENEKKYLVRPEWIDIKENTTSSIESEDIVGFIQDSSFFGDKIRYKILVDEIPIIAYASSSLTPFKKGTRVSIIFNRKYLLE